MQTGPVKPFMAQRFSSFLTTGEVSSEAMSHLASTPLAVEAENPGETYRSSEAFEAAQTAGAADGPFWDQAEVQAVSAPVVETPQPQQQGPSEVDRQIAELLHRTECELSAHRCEMTRSQLEAGQRVVEKSVQTSDSLHSTSSFTPMGSSYATQYPSYGTGGGSPAGGPSLGYMAPGTMPGMYPPNRGLAAMGYNPNPGGYGAQPYNNGYLSRY